MGFKLWLDANELQHTNIDLAKVDMGKTVDFKSQDTPVIFPQNKEVPDKGDVVIIQVGVKTQPKKYEVINTIHERGRIYLVVSEKRSRWGKFRDDLVLGIPTKKYTVIYDPKNFNKVGTNTWRANNPIV